MKKAVLILAFLMVSVSGAFSQSLHSVTFSLNGEGQYILNNKENLWEYSTIVGLSVNYTRIFDNNFSLMVDMNFGIPVHSIGKDADTGEIEEYTLEDFESVYVDNLYFGVGFAPVNRRGTYMTLTAGPNLNLMSQSFLLGSYKIEVYSVGLGVDWGMGFFINREAVFSVNLKAGYNFLGSVTYTFGEDSTTETLEDYHVFFVVPSLGFGFTF